MALASETGAQEMIVGRAVDHPLLSIVIPTYRRPDLLLEAVACAVGQDFDRPFEVVVVDDDPASQSHRLLLEAMPGLSRAPFRYLRHQRNVEMYGNMNSGLDEARGEWVTILHDDDLLDISWAREMFAMLDARPEIDGLICRKGNLDQREKPVGEGALKQLARRLVHFQRFGFRNTRRIDARKLFWECVGNTVGFVCRKRDLQEIGGFRPDEHPCADHFFYLRFAKRFRFEEYRKVLGTIRVADNCLLKPETHLACSQRNHEVKIACLRAGVPKWWARLIPLVTARQVAAMTRFYRVDVTPAQVSALLGIRIPKDRPLLMFTVRALLRGF